MGLDIVEYVLALESTFGITIPDADARRLETPRLVIDYLAGRLPLADEPVIDRPCFTQRAFYRARAAAAARFAVPVKELGPAAALRPLVGGRDGWRALRADLGAYDWPRLHSDHWLGTHLGGVRTLGELARHLALYDRALLRPAGAPWTRQEIETVVLQLLERETGVEMAKYTLDSRFVKDMGLD